MPTSTWQMTSKMIVPKSVTFSPFSISIQQVEIILMDSEANALMEIICWPRTCEILKSLLIHSLTSLLCFETLKLIMILPRYMIVIEVLMHLLTNSWMNMLSQMETNMIMRSLIKLVWMDHNTEHYNKIKIVDRDKTY